MKRTLAAVLALVLLTLCACKTTDEIAPAATDQPEKSVPPSMTEVLTPEELRALEAEIQALEGDDHPATTPTPVPVNTAPPMPLTAAYTYADGQSQKLEVSYQYPSTWIDNSSALSAVYDEAVEPGIVPARMAITRREAGNIVVTAEVGMDKLDAFLASLKATSTEFRSKRGKRFKFAGNVGFQFLYVGVFNGVKMKGYAAITYSQKKNAFYLFHFSASADRYDAFNDVRKTIIRSIKV